MAVFDNCNVLLDVKTLPFKEKKKLRSALLDNGGNITYVVNKQCSFVVTSSVDDLSSNRQKSIHKLQIPVVGMQYVWSCLDKGHLLPFAEHVLTPQLTDPSSQHSSLRNPELKVLTQIPVKGSVISQTRTEILEKGGPHPEKFRIYKGDHDLPEFPSHFQVAKYSFFKKNNSKTLSVLELQSAKGRAGQQYRVLCSIMHESEKVVWDKLVYCSTSEDALEAYVMLMKEEKDKGFTQIFTLPPDAERLASYSLKQLLLEEKLNCSTLSQEVGVFVELVWTEALGSLSKILTVPVSRISLNDVSRVEGLLLQAQKTQDEEKVKTLLEEVNTLLPLQIADPPSKHKLVSQKLDLCQLIRDILNVSEATMRSPLPSSLGKYRALRCSIDVVPSENPEFNVISQMLQDKPIQIRQILRVSRGVELQMFREELGNIKPLLHSTGTNSFVGILSRGLLLPRVGVEQHGIERTDIGNLGGGIYFSDSLMTSVKYSKPSVADGSRLLLVCDVALGQCKNLLKRDTTLTCAPEGYHSVHGVRRTPKTTSEFQDDEYVVYNTDQIKLKYVVQYTLEEDQLTEFHPQINTSEELAQPTEIILPIDDSEGLECTKNPLEEMTAGLLDSSGKTLPLKAVHVRCKLMDLLCQVIIFQTYTNQSEVPIEAKYVFPLEETAAVCGFEAFINGKHVIGKVKEKEQARKEYRQAIEKGHGAYLMDQDAPDVFTISVGNLPPGATVLIKVTFITELVVRGGSIIFSLPGSVAPWQQSAALNQKTQGTVEKISVTELQSEGEFSLCMSIEMPYEIINLESSHLIKIKRTDCRAVISTLPGQTLGSDGLQVTFSLSKIHMPRMWVEKHPDKESQACMLVFYPDFKSNSEGPSSVSDVIILLDTSESMRGDAILNARRIALQVLNSLDRSLKINIISFGTDYKEAFPAPVLLDETFESARKFIMSCNETGGSTELWRPLRSLSLIPPSHGMRNILLISDGHVQNQALTLQLVRENSCHTRVFTCGLSLTANRHMLRALAQAGGGTYEFFDTKMKHTWTEKVRAQVQRVESPGCRSVAVKWQQFNPTAPPPVQAPSQLHALFSDCHTLVYGFVPHCTQAMLFGDLSGQEIKTMVSTTELQKTKGTFLHKLTARAIIRDYEDGILGNSEAEHEGKKAELKSYITELSKEFSVLSQFTSFVAIEERDQNQLDTGFTDIPKLIAEEDVDILPYLGWTEEKQTKEVDIEKSLTDKSYLNCVLFEELCDYRSYESEEFDTYCGIMSRSDSSDYEGSPQEFISSPLGEGGIYQSLSHSADVYEDIAKRNVIDDSVLLMEKKSSRITRQGDYPSSLHPPPHLLLDAPFSVCENARRTVPNSMNLYALPQDPVFGASLSSFDVGASPPAPLAAASPPVCYAATSPLPPPFGVSPPARLAKASPLASSSPPQFGASPPAPSFGTSSPPVSLARAFPPAHLAKASLPVIYSGASLPPPQFGASPPAPSLGGPLLASLARAFPPAPLLADSPPSSFIGASPPVGARRDFSLKERPLPPPPTIRSAASLPPPPPPPHSFRSVPCYRKMSAAVSEQPWDLSSPEIRPSSERCLRKSIISSAPASGRAIKLKSALPIERLMLMSFMQVRRRSFEDTVAWDELFQLQHEDGYWECTGSLSSFLKLDVDFFANVFLKEKGICSLGAKAHADILRLVATLLVLQLIRVKKSAEGKLLQSLFSLKDSEGPRPMHWEAVKKAVDWACWADKQYPCVCSRLEFGWDWESSTRQLLGCDSPLPYSPLISVLERRVGF
ncbi:protein mono-ADP-ribosyltransferase PARP4-like isoform X2 [Paramisgurnus dabryanus]|uniref:protein mono-ADP-ribosyltransferase PARP4-like isoform X2 n=1 Tax=Paramisgurnus dabryanus TaxID=90735 RepID=UPI0031F43487